MELFTTAPTLTTDRLSLRGHLLADFEPCADLWGNPEVVRLISGMPFTPEQTWSRLLRYIGHWKALGFGYWVVETLEDQRFVGEVGFADYRRETKPHLGNRPEAGWVLSPGSHGQGFATEAARAIHDWSDRNLGVTETVCIFDPANAASRRIAEKLGYEREQSAHYAGSVVEVYRRASRQN